MPAYYSGLRNFHFLERILTERTALSVLDWVYTFVTRPSSGYRHLCSLFLVYKQNYSSATSITNWFDIVPDHRQISHGGQILPSKTCMELWPEPDGNGVSATLPSGDLISRIHSNFTNSRKWVRPDRYYNLNENTYTSGGLGLGGFLRSKYRSVSDPKAKNPDQLVEDFRYTTLTGRKFMRLFEVSLRAALSRSCGYIVILNPRAIGIQASHIEEAVTLLRTQRVDLVMGLTSSCTEKLEATERSGSLAPAVRVHPRFQMGLYLVAVTGGNELVLGAHRLTKGVEWGTPTAAHRLWANLTAFSPRWTCVCLRDRLPEIMNFEDIPRLEPLLGLPVAHLVEDSVTVIVPIGPGHADDQLQPLEDSDIIAAPAVAGEVDIHRLHPSLEETLDLIQRNSSGLRRIQVVVIDSRPSQLAPASPSSFCHWYRPDTSKSAVYLEFRNAPLWPAQQPTQRTRLPNRGELINYAVEHYARGSVLVFLEPGVHVPFEWDTAVFQCLEQPGVGMSSFAYRLALRNKYMQRKHIGWALRCHLANWLVNRQAARLQLPTAGQPLFLYAYYLRCVGGYPKSSRLLHTIDLCLAISRRVGRVTVARSTTASAGIPTNWLLRHGAVRGAFYASLVTIARLLGTSQDELSEALVLPETRVLAKRRTLDQSSRQHKRLPLIQPDYLDGY
ncbi:hypothetical protein AAHC03_019006 [Spirometra sp. Aus1]